MNMKNYAIYDEQLERTDPIGYLFYYEKAKSFIYRNARPIDYARWNYHFENGSVQNVVTVLKCYQNEDGGFGHALEADCWNPKSSPVQTWCATEILRELFLEHNEHDTYTYLKQTDLVNYCSYFIFKRWTGSIH